MSSKTTYTYNGNNKALVEIYQSYDTNTNTVSSQYKTTYSYNSNGDVIQLIDQDWNGTAWVNSYKFDITYSNNRISSGLAYEWNGSAWAFDEDSSNITINYNSNGTVSAIVSDSWDGFKWVTSDRTINSFDANNNLILQEDQVWDGSTWTTDYKEENTYDGNGNAITEKESYLDNGAFVITNNETNTFDTSKLMASFAHPFKDKTGLEFIVSGNGIVNKILTKTGENTRTTYNYVETTASTSNFNLLDFVVYPNPTTSILKVDDSSFSLKNIEVYNIIGKKIMISNKNELNLENLVNGIYLLKIQSENGNVATRRVVKN
ncbi:T9SS type A sorting domain-containing protein [uncultured Polaribacter sp.]|uniref:T9SS type A sorting domain-containing protein n=1 Tax=uncultured Polaribacter sp. TaxID=174711 RepID=UPI002639C755|nr:T9SS type A sorting domain-containing protein [uncultured Polaribacter sp.]